MKLVEKFEDKELKVGDTIKDDYGTLWYIVGYNSHGWVQLVENDKLAKIVKNYTADSFALRIEV